MRQWSNWWRTDDHFFCVFALFAGPLCVFYYFPYFICTIWCPILEFFEFEITDQKMRIRSDEIKYVGFLLIRLAFNEPCLSARYLVEVSKSRIKSRRVWEVFKSLRAANNNDARMKSLSARPTQINQYSAARVSKRKSKINISSTFEWISFSLSCKTLATPSDATVNERKWTWSPSFACVQQTMKLWYEKYAEAKLWNATLDAQNRNYTHQRAERNPIHPHRVPNINPRARPQNGKRCV